MALILIMFVMLYGKSSKRFQYEQKQACQGNLQNIYVALQIYANDGNGLFPVRKEAKSSEEALSLLIPRYTTVTAPFICPGTKGSPLPEGEAFEKRRISYAYYMGRRSTEGTAPLMSDAQVNNDPKLKGQQVTEVAQPHLAPVIDLMEALKKSLAEKQAPAAAPAAVSSAEAAPVPAGKKPPARAVQPIAVAQKRAGKKAAG